jgi:serine/threonine-protein kinase
MALTPGYRLGPYEILAIIGEGGMGQVYRARDTKLQRHVAIKVLPDAVTGDAERVARFDREARTLATLNHPHIAQIYGTEQSGITHALVMELVEGEDLAQRIARGPFSWREAEPIARQIAGALEAAHEMGIVHRDLKPANIKVTPDGVVKVLDFGLAKAIENGAAGPVSGPALANSPTITSPAGVTQAGMILGTAAYMSPEQSKGRPADKRSDVWAFGCVFYEMLTGRRAFPGDDVMETLSAVLRAEPDFAAIPRDIPPNVRTLIERCLIKDRRERISDVAVARYVLESANTISSMTSRPGYAGSRWMWALVAVVGIVALAAVAIPRFITPATPPAGVVRSTIAAPTASTEGFVTVAMSPQGTYIAYAALGSNSLSRLHVRKLSEHVARALPGTDGGANPFFSPDGDWLGFFAAGKLKKVPVAGGAAQVLADAPSGRGASWATDGTIVFVPTPEGGLYRVSADGGAVTRLTMVKPTERSHRWPHVLPGARTVLFTIQGAGKLFDDAVIAAVPIDGGEPQTIVEGGSSPQYLQSGHLVFGKAGTLLAIAFDPVAVRSSGAAITMIDNVRTNQLNGAVPFAVSSAGLLVYLPGENASSRMSLHRATRAGQTQLILENRLIDNAMNLSPDGHRVALAINDGQVDIWMVDLTSNGVRRFTFGPGSKTFPVWSRDGSRLYYGTTAGGSPHAVVKAVDGSGPEQTLTSTGFFPTSVSPDGGTVIGRAISTGFSFDVVGVDLAAQPPRNLAVVTTAANETQGVFSPDGQHVAYASDENGRIEVFVQAYPSGNKSQVTNGGGSDPRWTRGGRELIYRNGQSLAAVPITLKPFTVGAPQTLFTLPNLFAFDVTPDGATFVVAQDAQNRENVEFVLVSGWFEELRAKMQPSR